MTYILDVYGSRCKTDFLLWVEVTNLKAPALGDVGHAASTPERGMRCLLFESWLEDELKGKKGTAGLGRLVSTGWLRAHSGLGSGPMLWGLQR